MSSQNWQFLTPLYSTISNTDLYLSYFDPSYVFQDTIIAYNEALLYLILNILVNLHMICFGSRLAAQWKKKSLHLIFCKVNSNGFSYHFFFPLQLHKKNCKLDLPAKNMIKPEYINLKLQKIVNWKNVNFLFKIGNFQL